MNLKQKFEEYQAHAKETLSSVNVHAPDFYAISVFQALAVLIKKIKIKQNLIHI